MVLSAPPGGPTLQVVLYSVLQAFYESINMLLRWVQPALAAQAGQQVQQVHWPSSRLPSSRLPICVPPAGKPAPAQTVHASPGCLPAFATSAWCAPLRPLCPIHHLLHASRGAQPCRSAAVGGAPCAGLSQACRAACIVRHLALTRHPHPQHADRSPPRPAGCPAPPRPAPPSQERGGEEDCAGEPGPGAAGHGRDRRRRVRGGVGGPGGRRGLDRDPTGAAAAAAMLDGAQRPAAVLGSRSSAAAVAAVGRQRARGEVMRIGDDPAGTTMRWK